MARLGQLPTSDILLHGLPSPFCWPLRKCKRQLRLPPAPCRACLLPIGRGHPPKREVEGRRTSCFPFPLPSCRRTKLFLSSCPAILSSTSQWASFPDTRPKLHILVFPNTRAPSNQCIPTSHDLPPQTQDGLGGGEDGRSPRECRHRLLGRGRS